MRQSVQLPDGKKVKFRLRNTRSSLRRAEKYHGDFIDTLSGRIGFFFYPDSLCILISNQCYALDEFLFVKNFKKGDSRTLIISRGTTPLFEYRYKAMINYDVNPFWPEDEEDVDDLLWFSNVVNNPERLAVLREHRRSG